MKKRSVTDLLDRVRTNWLLLLALPILLGTALVLGLGGLLWEVAALCAVLLLPGFALQGILAPDWDGDLVDAVVVSIGLSLAALPLLLAWMTWLGGRWTPGLVIALLVACAATRVAAQRLRRTSSTKLLGVDIPAALLLLVIFALTLALRLDHLRGVLMPAWSDSYQHVMVSKLIIEGGRVPAGYGPLIGIDSFRYHFGFHSLVAFWAWLTGLAPHVAVLWMGQVVNALSPLTIYLFLAYGLKDRRAGVVGALVVGLLTISPANHVNFGRYPQLTGQVLLPVVMALTLRTLWAEEGESQPWLAAAVSAAGLCLAHYRVILFYACFVVANLLVLAWVRRREWRRLWRILLETGRLAGVATLLIAPWLVHLALASVQHLERSTAFATSDSYHYLSWEFVVTWSVPASLVVGAALGAAWGLLRRARLVVVLVLWVALLFLLSNPRLLGLPTTFVNNGAVVLMLYLPVGMLGGDLASEALRETERVLGQRATIAMLAGVVLVGSAIGLRTLNRRILEPWRFFVTPDDVQAYAWIREHVPEDAIFAVQAYYEITPLVMHGVDGGYWLPYMTGRRSTLPPMPYAGELTLGEAEPINRRALDTRRLPGDHEALARLQAQGVTHAYVVEPRNDWALEVWQPETFAADSAYRLLYHRGTVWIFAFEGSR